MAIFGRILYMKRDIQTQIRDFILSSKSPKDTLIIEGARQVGKTHLVEDVIRNFPGESSISINLEKDLVSRNDIENCKDFSEFTTYLTKLHGFNESEHQIIFFDEAQESKQLARFVRSFKEDWKNKSVILTGSSMTRLFDDVRVPVGRISYLRVSPFSFREFLRAIDKEQLLEEEDNGNFVTSRVIHQHLLGHYDEYLNVGGLPEAVLEFTASKNIAQAKKKAKQIFLAQEDDFIRKESRISQHLYRRAIETTANSLPSPFTLKKVSDKYDEASSTVNILTKWHLLLSCQQKSHAGASEKLHPKMYLYDVGLAKALRQGVLPDLSVIDTADQVLRTPLGGVIENAIIINLLSGSGFLREINGWKKSSQSSVEVDFIYEATNQRRVPIEVKASLKSHSKFFSPVKQYLELSGETLGILVSGAQFSEHYSPAKKTRLINIPVYYSSSETIEKLAEM